MDFFQTFFKANIFIKHIRDLHNKGCGVFCALGCGRCLENVRASVYLQIEPGKRIDSERLGCFVFFCPLYCFSIMLLQDE